MYVLSIVVCPFVLFLLAIVLSVLLRYTVSDCPFGIFKLFLLLLNYLAFRTFDYERRIRCRSFEKSVVCTKLDIFVFTRGKNRKTIQMKFTTNGRWRTSNDGSSHDHLAKMLSHVLLLIDTIEQPKYTLYRIWWTAMRAMIHKKQ
jgi:hypothetical protein